MRPPAIRVGVCALLLSAVGTGTEATANGSVTTARVSITHSGAQADRPSAAPSVSGDGRYVAFLSDSAQIVQGDTNNATDVFLFDRRTGSQRRISVNSSANESRFTDPTKAPNAWPVVTGNGRYVAFSSGAWNLVAGDTNELSDIFVRDTIAGTTVRASVGVGGAQPNGHSVKPAISDDGRFVAFESAASNLVAGDTNGAPDIFVRDLQAGTTQRVSVRWDGLEVPKGGYGIPAMSADGRFIAFHSVERLHPYDQNGIVDVYVYDRQSGTIEGGSLDSTGKFAEGNSWDDVAVTDPVIDLSSDGRFVVFESGTPTLVAGDTNVARDIFVRDRVAATTRRVSVSATGRQLSGPSRTPSISDNGRWVSFVSDASDVVTPDTNGSADVFVHDISSGTTERRSVTAGGAEADGASSAADLTTDGSAVVFASIARNLVPSDTNGMQDVFVRGAPLPAPPPAPTIVSPVESSTVRTAEVTITGTAVAGAAVRILESNTIVATAVADGSGTWTTTSTFAEGLHTVNAIASVDGVDSVPSPARNFFVQLSGPVVSAPLIQHPTEGLQTNQTTIAASGWADPAVTVTVTENGSTLGATTSAADGAWSVTFTAPEGPHTIVATAANDTSQASSLPRSFTVDTTPPPPPSITSPAFGEVVYANPVTISGTTDPRATVFIFRDSLLAASVVAGANGSWSRAIALNTGNNEIVVRARDAAGNFGTFGAPHVVRLEPDTVAPTTTFDNEVAYHAYAPGEPALVQGTASDNVKVVSVEVVVRTLQNVEVTKPSVTCSGCGTAQATWTATPTLQRGVYRVYVFAYDGAGLRSAQNFITVARL